MNEKLMREYAKIAVTTGVNIQKGQVLVVNTSVEIKEMTRLVVEEAYLAGAKKVIVNYNDDKIARLHYEHASEETLCDVADYQVEHKVDPLRKGAAVLSLISDTPEILKGLDAKKIGAVSMALQNKYQEASALTMANKVQWCVVGVPNVAWAQKVFPTLEAKEALQALWEAILKSVHVVENQDALAAWKQHNEQLATMVSILNAHNFESLHFKNAIGTDLSVTLVPNHIWAGGSEESVEGVVFNPNMPTEEVFTMPYKYGVNGTVVSSKPLHYNGNIIPSFSLTFKKGKVVSYHAEEEMETLKTLLAFDEGSSYIGEVALVPYSSPISQSNILFFNTLYDENASCHLALGRAYPMNVAGGVDMSQEELDAVGSNHSLTHVDFMFGTSDMEIEGIMKNGDRIPVFKKGDFVI